MGYVWTMPSRRFAPTLAGLMTCLVVAWWTPAAVAAHGEQRTVQVARYAVFEQTLRWRSNASNPWEQVAADVRLVSPTQKIYRIGGFYSSPGIWKFRFAPPALGRWSWSASIKQGSRSGSYRGSFDTVKGPSPGFVRQSPYNPLRWVFTNGAPYYPIGINDCSSSRNIPLSGWGLDGLARQGGGTQPEHQLGRLVDMNTYMQAYSPAFDLFRWGPDNCSFSLYAKIDPSGNVYSQSGGAAADRLFQTLRRYGFRIEMVLFGSSPPFTSDADSSDPAKIAAVERYAKYVVDRYGAYVDFWELMNEANASTTWLTQIATTIHQLDPYAHPVGTNWSQPQLGVMNFGSDHWYESEDPLQSDAVAWARLRGEPARALGKPTLVDEQGNIGRNWDPTSGVRMRLRSWTAFFAETTLVFWNASFANDYVNPAAAASLYIGPDERRYVRVLQNYTRGFDPRAVVAGVSATPSGAVRGYALGGPLDYGLYLVAADDHTTPLTGVRVTVVPQRAGLATWIDPDSGRVLAQTKVPAGSQSLAVPAFTVDVALKIS